MFLNSLIRSCKLENDRVKVRLPIQKGLLEMMLFELERQFDDQPYLEILYKTIFCLAYYGMLRVGEMAYSPHTIKACKVHVGNNKDKILLVLYTSKTHGKESKPQRIKVSAVPMKQKDTKFFCPFATVINYMSARGTYLSESEPFFIFKGKTAMKAEQIRTPTRSILEKLNLDSSLYDVHSWRIGRTCDLYKFGYSIEQIKIMGRWKSNAVYRYLKNY